MKFRFYTKYKLKIISPKKYPIAKINGKKLIFIHINKTAGTSILSTLGKKKFHLNCKDIIQLIGRKKFDSAVKFAVCRNPYDRALSMYYHRIKTNQSNLKNNPIDFNSWVEKVFSDEKDTSYYNKDLKMFAPQIDWLKDENNCVVIDNILKFENLDAEFLEFSSKFGINKKLPKLNLGVHKKDRKEVYNLKSVKIIQERFKEDFDFFNYSLII